LGDTSKEIYNQILEGKYKLPSSLIASVEIITFINGLLQYDPQKRLDWDGIKRHDFLNKNVQEFTYIKLNSIKENAKDEIEMNVKNNINILWILFKAKNSSFNFDQINFINMNETDKKVLAQKINENKIDNGHIVKALNEEKIKIKEEKERLIGEKDKIEQLIKEAENMKLKTNLIRKKMIKKEQN
jgi:serine/threonine protein kinase